MQILILILALLLPSFTSCSSMDAQTPEEGQIRATMVEQMTQLQTALINGELTESAIVEIGVQIDALQKAIAAHDLAIAERGAKGWLDWLPLGPLDPFKNLLAGGLAFLSPRVRSNAKKGIRALSKGDFKNVLLSIPRTIGLVHTNSNPIDILKGAAHAAREQGNIALADAIDVQIASMLANPPVSVTVTTA